MKFLLIVHFVVTWALVGLIWTIQQVHYPLFAFVGNNALASYISAHMSRITLLVLPLMAIELITAFTLTIYPPPTISSYLLWVLFGLVIFIWLTTLLINVPQHNQLAVQFDETIHHTLVISNWLRTIIWTVRGVAVAWILWTLIEV